MIEENRNSVEYTWISHSHRKYQQASVHVGMDSLWMGLDDLDLEEMLGERDTDLLGDEELLRSGDLKCLPFTLGVSSSLLDSAAVDIILSVGGEFERLRDLIGDRDRDLDLDLLTGDAVLLETLETFLSCLKRLSTLFLF